MMKVCPRCGNKTDASVCPICFTLITPTVAAPAEKWSYLTPQGMQYLPPFTCPNCGGKRLMTSNLHRYRCGDCGVLLTLPSRPAQAPAKPQQEDMLQELSVEETHPEPIQAPPTEIPPVQAASEEAVGKEDAPIEPNQTIPGFTLPKLAGEEPSAVEKEIDRAAQASRNEPPHIETEFERDTAPFAEDPTPLPPKKKKSFSRGGLIAVLCGIMLLFLIGTGIAVAVEGFVKTDTFFDDIITVPDGGDTFSDYEDFFSDIPGFSDDFFSQIPGFEEDSSSNQQNDAFGEVDGDPFGDETLTPEYPNGCSSAEFEKLKAGMTYGQISAIIGGDAANFYDTTDAGEKCTVFQWITENATGYISVKFVDGVAADFYAGEQ